MVHYSMILPLKPCTHLEYMFPRQLQLHSGEGDGWKGSAALACHFQHAAADTTYLRWVSSKGPVVGLSPPVHFA